MSESMGKVYLVGAGPGDPGLITMKGHWALLQADVVLYDGLVNPLILRNLQAEVIRTCRAKSQDGSRLPQDQINQTLIESALAGKIVVRLKGGDPYIFGRGAEEAIALHEAGIPFEVIPGVTAATAAGIYAGLSFTHRQFASAVALITGHEDPTKATTSLDYGVLSKFPGTLVFYMGLHRVKQITAELMKNGLAAETPAVLVSRATLSQQQTVSATVGTLAEKVQQANVSPPSLIVIGKAVELSSPLNWFDNLPLKGKRIGITRPEGQAEAVVQQVQLLGGDPVLLPTIDIVAPPSWDEVDEHLPRLHEFDWIVFTSANGVRFLFQRLWQIGLDSRTLGSAKLATIGTSTANALEQFHLKSDLIPSSFRAESLAESLKPLVVGKNVLWPRANRGRDVLPSELDSAGASVTELIVYHHRDRELHSFLSSDEHKKGELDWVGLSSPAIARNVSQLYSHPEFHLIPQETSFASISPVTTEAAREVGLPIHVEATTYTWEGMIDAIIHYESM